METNRSTATNNGQTSYRCYAVALVCVLLADFNRFFPKLVGKVASLCLDFDYGVGTCVLLAAIVALTIYKSVKYIKNKTIIDHYTTSLLLWCVLTYVYYRWCSNAFFYEELVGEVKYADVLWGCGLWLLLLSLCLRLAKRKDEDEAVCETPAEFISDQPISDNSEDKLYFGAYVAQIAQGVMTKKSKSYSIAIVSTWGDGKTSFMNLLKNELEKHDDIVLIEFNPRHSASVANIQSDFFALLTHSLLKYHTNLLYILSRYVSALGIKSNGFIVGVENWFVKPNSLKERERMDRIMREIGKKLVVFIDDFDRLTRDEILEIFKLIDNNAAFPNTNFITAFDKQYVESVLNIYGQKDSNAYSDKFFTLQFHLPLRSDLTYLSYMVDLIAENTTLDIVQLRELIYSKKLLFAPRIHNMRDAKRFANLFIQDYTTTVGEVFLLDYMLISLIKFAHYDEYKLLYKKEYVEGDGLFSSSFYVLKEQYCARNDFQSQRQTIVLPKSIDILRDIFPESMEGLDREETFLSVIRVNRFNVYFENKIFGKIPQKELNELFNVEEDEVMTKLCTWDSMKLLIDVESFLLYLPWNNFQSNGSPDTEKFKKYVRVVMLYMKHMGENNSLSMNVLLSRILYKPNLASISNYGMTDEGYKAFMMEMIRRFNPDHCCSYLLNSLMDKKHDKQTENDYFVKAGDLQEYLLTSLNAALDEAQDYSLDLLTKYQRCIDSIATNGTIVIIKEANKAMREFLEKKDRNHVFLDKFLYKNQQGKNDFIRIEFNPFARHIFNVTNDTKSDNFLEYVENSSVDEELKEAIKTVWKLAKSTGFNEMIYVDVPGSNEMNWTDLVKHLQC